MNEESPAFRRGSVNPIRKGTPPDALDWHPWYRDKTWLLEWLESDDFTDLAVPVRNVMRFRAFDADAPITAGPREALLRKQIAVGPAPYVGRPFLYEWNVATDQFGRSIAGESRIVYRP